MEQTRPATSHVLSAVCLALAGATAFAIAGFLAHIPGLSLTQSARVVGILLIWSGTLAVLATRWGVRLLPSALGGVLSAAVALLLLGAALVEQPDPASFTDGHVPLRPGAPLIAIGFIGLGGFLGFLAGLIARPLGARAREDVRANWTVRLAMVAACSLLPLILTGGAVTSTESGMAVRGWPDTFGANMFLYPLSLLAQPRVFVEHSHRLFGMFAGVCSIALTIHAASDTRARRWFPWCAGFLVVLVVQGVAGGQRVVQNNPYLGALHGAIAQLIVAFAWVLASWMSRTYQGMRCEEPAGVARARRWGMIALSISIVQLVLGAMYRHLRRGGSPSASHIVWTHAALAAAVLIVAVIAGAMLIRTGKQAPGLEAPARRVFRTLGAGIHGSVGLQFALGWVAFMAVWTSQPRGEVPLADELAGAPAVPVGEVLATLFHHANGALYLTLTMVGWAWARKASRAPRS